MCHADTVRTFSSSRTLRRNACLRSSRADHRDVAMRILSSGSRRRRRLPPGANRRDSGNGSVVPVPVPFGIRQKDLLAEVLVPVLAAVEPSLDLPGVLQHRVGPVSIREVVDRGEEGRPVPLSLRVDVGPQGEHVPGRFAVGVGSSRRPPGGIVHRFHRAPEDLEPPRGFRSEDVGGRLPAHFGKDPPHVRAEEVCEVADVSVFRGQGADRADHPSVAATAAVLGDEDDPVREAGDHAPPDVVAGELEPLIFAARVVEGKLRTDGPVVHGLRRSQPVASREASGHDRHHLVHGGLVVVLQAHENDGRRRLVLQPNVLGDVLRER
mmetsp:Transcript_12997/g.30664  ORF Transcript_12997/g.30664 Transcript_12997/m.30664 type:complete len:324 (+) Transcript_12997:216-1187(+)